MMKREWRQNLSHYEEFAGMAAGHTANYHQTHVCRQLQNNYNNDGHEDDAGDAGDAAAELRSSEESVEGSRRGFARGGIISYIRTLRGS